MTNCSHCKCPEFACLCGVQSYKVPAVVTSIDLAKVKVFIAHHAGEAEVSEPTLRAHVRITGAIPKVGESLRAVPANVPHRLFSLPFGKVIRVEHLE